MAVLVLLFLLISALFGGSDAAWCVCRGDLGSAALQTTLDYACGAGADCTPILQNGNCYEPNTVAAHCSYAANSYYQRQNGVASACNFAGTAMVTTADPSYSGCIYPANASAAGTGSTPAASSPGSSTTGTPTGTLTPPTSTGVPGLGPTSSTGTSTDGNGAVHLRAPADSLSLAVILSGLVLLGGWR